MGRIDLISRPEMSLLPKENNMQLLICDDGHERLLVTHVSTREDLDKLYVELRGEIAEHGVVIVELWRSLSPQEQEVGYREAKQAYAAKKSPQEATVGCG